MNRREAVAALMALPAVQRIATAAVRPKDVIVIECDEIQSSQQIVNIERILQPIWPDNRILVLSGGKRIKVLEAGT